MPSRNIKSYLAVVAAAAAVGFAAPAVASAGFAATPASALAAGPSEGAGKAPAQDARLTQFPGMNVDPHGYWDDGAQSAVLCATAIEYGLIAA
ncbi:MAG TPA: hypothetical protein VGF32_29745 [Streptosporangiaceae bacterium]|jgi:hypothetical protein